MACERDREWHIERSGYEARYEAVRAEIVAALARAAHVIDDEPDQAAWLLDGALQRLLALWYLGHRQEMPPAEAALRDLECADAELGMRFRLALRAPHAHARLAHCQSLLDRLDRLDAIRPGAVKPPHRAYASVARGPRRPRGGARYSICAAGRAAVPRA